MSTDSEVPEIEAGPVSEGNPAQVETSQGPAPVDSPPSDLDALRPALGLLERSLAASKDVPGVGCEAPTIPAADRSRRSCTIAFEPAINFTPTEALVPERPTIPSEVGPELTPREASAASGLGVSIVHGASARASRVDPNIVESVVTRLLADDTFIGTIVEHLAQKTGDRLTHELAAKVAREVIDTGGDQLARTVAELIADAWQRAARTTSAAAGNGWTLRPRQRGTNPSRGRNPRA